MHKYTRLLVLFATIVSTSLLLGVGPVIYGPMLQLDQRDENTFPSTPDGGSQYRGALIYGTDAGRVYVNTGVSWQRLAIRLPDGGIN